MVLITKQKLRSTASAKYMTGMHDVNQFEIDTYLELRMWARIWRGLNLWLVNTVLFYNLQKAQTTSG